jgi:hypothetical protein
VSDLIAEKESGSHEEGETPAKRVRAERRCGRCGEVGHNSRTCKVEIEDVDDSEEYKVQSTVVYSKKYRCGVAQRCRAGVLVR